MSTHNSTFSFVQLLIAVITLSLLVKQCDAVLANPDGTTSCENEIATYVDCMIQTRQGWNLTDQLGDKATARDGQTYACSDLDCDGAIQDDGTFDDTIGPDFGFAGDFQCKTGLTELCEISKCCYECETEARDLAVCYIVKQDLDFDEKNGQTTANKCNLPPGGCAASSSFMVTPGLMTTLATSALLLVLSVML